MNVALDQTINVRSTDLFRSLIIEFNRSKNLDDTGWDGMGLGWMAVIGHRSSKITFSANERGPNARVK